jgi:hypothetical protein
MDVQAGAIAASPPIAPAAAAAPAPAPAPLPDPQPSGSGSIAPASGGTGTGAGSTVGAPPAPPGSGTAANGAASNQPHDTTLSPVVAKLFNASAQNVEVSFQVLHNPDEVVTVFTDKTTGKEIVQFPSQALIALAEMYDKDAGNVLDKSV